MATVGGTVLRTEAFEFFDALRSFDVEKAIGYLAVGAVIRTPDTTLSGDEIKEHFTHWLSTPETRPSLTIRDINGDGSIIHMTVSVSQRAGRAPHIQKWSMLCTHGKIQQIVMQNA